jgi:tetratricopeptide (TPR) repeat protein
MKKGTFMNLTVNEERDSLENQLVWVKTDFPISDEVHEINKEISETPDSADLWMKKGLALSKSWQFREAIDAYSMALSFDPYHSLVYRHRGHRYISIRMYKEAAADLELSTRIDGTNWDAWYHLGLAYYLLGDFERAEKVYSKCLELTHTDDLLVAIADWYWMTLMRLGRKAEAQKLLEPISEETNPGENVSYLRRLLLYKGLLEPKDLLYTEDAHFPDLELATQGYGLGNYYLVTGDEEKAMDMFKRIVEEAKTQWGAFGYLAAEMELEK